MRTVAFPVRDGQVGIPQAVAPSDGLAAGSAATDPRDRERARDMFGEARKQLRQWLCAHQDDLTKRLRRQLDKDGVAAVLRENERYRSQEGEVSALIERSTVGRLTREIEALKIRRSQGHLSDDAGSLARLDLDIEEKQREIERRRSHYEEVRAQLSRERTRILDRLLPALRAAGKPPKVALTAVMRKLVILVNVLVQEDRLWTLTPAPPHDGLARAER